MIKFVKYLLPLMIIVSSIGCNISQAQRNRTAIIDFGDPNAGQLKRRLSELTALKKTGQVVTITQFGDSHTAADLFTGKFRTLLQKKYGDAGIGWITPISVKGQYNTAVTWHFSNWKLLSSRVDDPLEMHVDFPMGGFIAKPILKSRTNASIQKEIIEITPNILNHDLWKVKVQLKMKNQSAMPFAFYGGNGNKAELTYQNRQKNWQTVSATLKMPLRIESQDDVEIGSVWLIHDKPSGVVVSAIATNGARQSIWKKWNHNWVNELAESQSDLVILAYGVNESFDPTLDLKEYQFNLIKDIRQIHQTLPNAAVLLISPPDAMIAKNQAPPLFSSIKSIQYQIAKSEKTLYWDWQQAMGGQFVIEKWLRMGLARPDLVHQTRQGYQKSAEIFYTDFIEFIEKR